MDGAVCDCCQLFVVRHDDEGLAVFVSQVEEELVQFSLILRVQRTAGLVGQDDLGVVDEGAGYGHALFLAARQFVGLVLGAVGQLHKLQ